ncbi:homeobox protein 2 [Eurosta solidaginis]|uniref:homeobox protein 2 n=1 Tax=Eurosta solidaginis TaxID=178769 RepID=UPI0035315D27
MHKHGRWNERLKMLPQLTLNAKIIILLMVMFAFVVPAYTKTKDYVLMLTTHNDRALHINDVGKVTAANIAFAQPITMDIVGDPFNGDPFFITLYAKQVGLFLCFRRGRLVGLKQLTRDCHFSETIEHGHFMYANAYNGTLRVGFTKRFKPIGPKRLQQGHSISKDHFLFERRHLEDIIMSRSTSTTTKRTTTTSTTTTKTTTITKPTHIQHNKQHNSHNHNSNNDNSAMLRHSIDEERQQPQVQHTEAAKSITNDKHNNSQHSHSEHNNNSNSSINNNNKSNNKNNHNKKQQQSVVALDTHEVQKLEHATREHPLRHDGNSIRNKNRRRRLQNRRKHQQQKHQHNLQAKNLVRHHNNNSTKMARRRQHEREQLLRKQSRQRQQLLARHERQHREQTLPPPPPPARDSDSATSSSASTAASALTATAASLVPTTLIDIMAMLAASRRKRGRRKKDVAVEEGDTSTRTAGVVGANSGKVRTHEADMQIAVAHALIPSASDEKAAANRQKTERLQLDDMERVKAKAQSQAALHAAQEENSSYATTQWQRKHTNNARQQALDMNASKPVNAVQHVAGEEVAQAARGQLKLKQQINEYSNSYVNSNLYSDYDKLNIYANNDNINNVYINAIPALPKNYFNDNTHQRANYDVHSDVADNDEEEDVKINNSEHMKAAGKQANNVSHSAKAHSKSSNSGNSANSKSSSRQNSDSINPSMTDSVSSNRIFKLSQHQQQQHQQPQQTLSHSRLRYRRRVAVTEATNEAAATTTHDVYDDNDVAKHIDVDRHVAEQHLPNQQQAQQQADLVENVEVAAKLISSVASFGSQTSANTNNKNTNIPIKETKTNILNANIIKNNLKNIYNNLNVNSKNMRNYIDNGIGGHAVLAVVAAADDNIAKDNNVRRNFFGIRLPFFRQPSINNNNNNNNNNHVMRNINNNINMDVVAYVNANQMMNVNANANLANNNYNNNINHANPINVAALPNNENANNNAAAAAVALAAGNLANAAYNYDNHNVIDANLNINNYNNDNNNGNIYAANNDNISNVYEHLFTAYYKRFFRSLNYANTNHNVNNYNDDDHGDDKDDDDERKRNHNKYDMTIVQYRYVVVFYFMCTTKLQKDEEELGIFCNWE